jgi:hypothetical protein
MYELVHLEKGGQLRSGEASGSQEAKQNDNALAAKWQLHLDYGTVGATVHLTGT